MLARRSDEQERLSQTEATNRDSNAVVPVGRLSGQNHRDMLHTEGQARALFAEEVSAAHFADTARARQAGEAAAAAGAADDARTARCYQLVRRPSARKPPPGPTLTRTPRRNR
jgi:hypothetical protein